MCIRTHAQRWLGSGEEITADKLPAEARPRGDLASHDDGEREKSGRNVVVASLVFFSPPLLSVGPHPFLLALVRGSLRLRSLQVRPMVGVGCVLVFYFERFNDCPAQVGYVTNE
ncbi:hypothetical protein MRX96_048374 [Rhipicephalus microplus]